MKTLILFFISVFLFSCTEKKALQPNQAKTEPTENLQLIIDSLQKENDSLTGLLKGEKTKPVDWYKPIYDGNNLLRKGIDNPAEFIEKSLKEQPTLIPIKGVLGGTMHFTEIQPLSDEWVIANYEDGHIAGKAIYKYKLNKNGKLEFELLDAIDP